MANVVWCEDPAAVNGTTGDAAAILWAAKAGAVTYDTSVKNNGPGSWKCDSTPGNAVANLVSPANSVSDAGFQLDFYINFVNFPASTINVVNISDSIDNHVFTLCVTSGGVLQLRNTPTGLQIGSDGPTLSPGTTYRICLAGKIVSTTNYTLICYSFDGSSALTVITGTNTPTLDRKGSTQFSLGWVGTPGANAVLHFQNVVVGNATDSSDLGGGRTDLGVLLTGSKRPFANGTTNGFSTFGSAGPYGTGQCPLCQRASRERDQMACPWWGPGLPSRRSTP